MQEDVELSGLSRLSAWISIGTILLALATSSVEPARASDAAVFNFLEKRGPHGAGLRVVEQYDYSRTYRPLTADSGKPSRGERARPLQTLIWYPAERSSVAPMTVGDYLDLLARETSFTTPAKPVPLSEWDEGLIAARPVPMRAVRDAALAAGRFPLVVYAPSFSSTAWENADLCEYLASHGYVVVASPSLGVASRRTTLDLPGVETQARDISFLIAYAQTLPNTDMSKVAVAGFSWGGLSGLFAAARDKRIHALVALDGSLRYFPGLVVQAGDVHPERMTIPLLYIAQGEITLEELKDPALRFENALSPAPSVLNAWTHGDLVMVRMLGLAHGAFSSMFQRNEKFWKDPSLWRKADYDRADAMTSYAWMARYTREFLDAYLREDAAARVFLERTPAENGVPRHFMAVNRRARSGVPSTPAAGAAPEYTEDAADDQS
jgi:dienelactone hydrolase